jgi:hypothetical protein
MTENVEGNMSETIYYTQLRVKPEQAGTYLTLPFEMPENIAALELSYSYHRYDKGMDFGAPFTPRNEVNIIDLGLIAPDGSQVGTSGSDKLEIRIDESHATPGYKPCPLVPGTWQIIVGAYKVEPEGVTIAYEIRMIDKELRLLKGDLHAHTLASDGVHTLEELGWKAKRHGLDFIAITDHNLPVSKEALPQMEGLTFIPGVEWTHYQGHANFLGVDTPYDGPFIANTPEEIQSRFNSARQRGALITVNHPYEDCCVFKLDMNSLPFDCLEIWNGPMRESNLKALGLWQSLLAAGKKIPAVGGSDYHRDTPFIFLGGPTTCVYAMSAGASDILAALKAGHAYITFAPNGPWLELTAGEYQYPTGKAMMGDTVPWPEVNIMDIHAGGLLRGDVLRVVTGTGSQVLLEAPSDGEAQLQYEMTAPGFARVEILRAFLPGIPMLPALLSNPMYFEAG